MNLNSAGVDNNQIIHKWAFLNERNYYSKIIVWGFSFSQISFLQTFKNDMDSFVRLVNLTFAGKKIREFPAPLTLTRVSLLINTPAQLLPQFKW